MTGPHPRGGPAGWHSCGRDAGNRGRGGREKGAGSVLVVTGAAVVLVVLLVTITMAGGTLARHRAAAAADLAALAAAETVRTAAGDPCAAADRVSAANGARLEECSVGGGEVDVVTRTTATGALRWLPDPSRRARALVEPSPYYPHLDDDTGPPPGTWNVPLGGGYRLTARFGAAGPWWESGRHSGLDFAAPVGTPVVAAAAGVVVQAGTAGPYGRLVVVDHGGGTSTYYAHLSSSSVTAGDRVAGGQRLGAVGATGNATGPHLHFEVRVGGVAQDPERFLPMSP